MTTTFETTNGKFVKIWNKGQKEDISFFPSNSVAYIYDTTVTIIRSSIHAENEITLKISEIDGLNSKPSFTTNTRENLKTGMAQFFTVKGMSNSDSSGGGSGGGDSNNGVSGTDISSNDLTHFKQYMIGRFGGGVMDLYGSLVEGGIITDIPELD